jgi:predicted nucleic acid-binding protein
VAAYFLDSSAAVKLYVAERGTAWLTSLVDPSQGHELFIARVTPVEIAAALYRRVATGTLAATDADAQVALLRLAASRTFVVLEMTPAVSELAIEMAAMHQLRGYDCIQLAVALMTQRQRSVEDYEALTFVSADLELNNAASSERLRVADPNEQS